MSQSIPVDVLKQTISYFYLLSYCHPEHIADFKESTADLRTDMATKAGMKEDPFFKAAIPEACRRITSFHEATSAPSKEWVEALQKAAKVADKSSAKAAAFQTIMSDVARLKGRASPENRLHRKKGCVFCQRPCDYGYFSLVSEPEFNGLQQLLEMEAQRPKQEQNPIRPVLEFTLSHLAKFCQAGQGIIQRVHLGNLAYCLLMLSMAKSRLALPEAELQAFQGRNQAWIQADS